MTGVTIDRNTIHAELTLPQDFDLECQIIGLVLMASRQEQGTCWRDFCHLSADDFHDPMNRNIWQAIHSLHGADKRVDFSTVFAETAAVYGGVDDRGSMAVKQHMGHCVDSIVSRISNTHYAAALREIAEKRRTVQSLLAHAHRTAVSGFSVPASELAGTAIIDLQAGIAGRSDLVGATSIIAEIEADLDAPVKASPTGLPRLDAALRGGLHEGRTYGLVADQKAGKTTLLAPTISYNLAKQGEPHVYICLEMQPKEIFQRYLARWMHEETGVSINTDIFYDRAQTNEKWFRDLLREAVSVFDEKRSGMLFLRRPRMPLAELRSTLARIALSGRYKGVIVDYMQLISGNTAGNKTDHLDDVAQTIAEICTNNDMWSLIAAQMNADGGVRGGVGLRAAADMLLALHKIEFPGMGDEAAYYKSWIEMQATRYTPTIHIGDEEEPAYDFRTDSGPCYQELKKTVPQNLTPNRPREPEPRRWGTGGK